MENDQIYNSSGKGEDPGKARQGKASDEYTRPGAGGNDGGNGAKSKDVPAPDKRDAVFVAVAFGLGFALCELVLFGGWGISVPVICAALYAAALIYLRPRLRRPQLPELIANVPAALLAVCFVLFDNATLRAFNIVALWGASAFGLAQLSGLGGRPVLWSGTVPDTLRYMFGLPLRHLGRAGRALASSGHKARTLPIVLLTLLVIAPVLALVLMLLSQSDAGFSRLLYSFSSFFGRQAAHYLTEVIIAAVLTFPIFSFLWGLRRDDPARRPDESAAHRNAKLDSAVVCTALGVFSAVYAVYMALQSDYFFSAVLGALPQDFTVSQYARRGFFELVGVAAINFCLIAAACAFSKRREGRIAPGARGQIIVLSVMTLLLIVTAASKMLMYMERYGLTPLRVYTSWFMLLLAVSCALVIVGMLRRGFDFHRVNIICAVVLWLALNFINPDSIIAKYNINMYKANPTTKLDVSLFWELSDSALPQLASLRGDPALGTEISGDPTLGTEINRLLEQREVNLRSQKWQDFSAAGYSALKSIDASAPQS